MSPKGLKLEDAKMGPPLNIERPRNNERTNMTPPPSLSQLKEVVSSASQAKRSSSICYFEIEGYEMKGTSYVVTLIVAPMANSMNTSLEYMERS
uniref:Uncharacterized protein n=1 Tax=Cannabis sativa TaxID=3483 RepID=A0A803PME4_CANSA